MLRVFLAATALAMALTAPLRAETTFLQSFRWSDDLPGFGGFSAIELDSEGLGFIILSDRGLLAEGRLTRDAEGRITAAMITDSAPILDNQGRVMTGQAADAEGLALAPDGTLFISFEGDARVRQQQGLHGIPELLPRHADFAGMQPNASLEALAIGPDGAIYTIPERSGRVDRPFPVYRFRDGAWDIPFTIPRRDSFQISGADVGPDGLLYVLERDFSGFGFSTRVRRFDLNGGSEEVLLSTGIGRHDNLEGISVWHDGTGIRISMIADDNFNWFQQTQIVEYRVSD